MQSCSTPDRHGYSVCFSPFQPNHLLLATSQLYGLAGGGTLFLLKLPSTTDGKGLTQLSRMEWSDGLFDVAWCPYADNIAATASGDGSLQIWGGLNQDIDAEATLTTLTQPLMVLQEHKNEVYSINWGEQWNYHQLLSASWDGTIKLWDCHRQNSVATCTGHSDL
ncbi:PREDICTED: peroxisomal targeting signal 2 receptor-like, partial [Rhagoletis zephyria]|uniref:peroxisomal targeting signal 2 receptor-like n=1 Tax=Rhagoletis zephyria TaxID=28612 RepID=UPI000811629E